MKKAKIVLIAIAIISVVLVSAFDLGDIKSKIMGNSIDESWTLTIYGSNTIGAELMPALIDGYLKNLGATDIVHSLGINIEEKMIKAKVGKSTATIDIKAYGSSTGFDGLVYNKCDIAMSSKPVPSSDKKRLLEKGDMQSPECEHVIALDGLCIIVNNKNPIENISLENVKSIYAEEILNWKSIVPKYSGVVQTYRRDNNSGTHEIFKKLVMGKSAISENSNIAEDNNSIVNDVMNNQNAIGYTTMSIKSNVKKLPIYVSDNIIHQSSKFAVQIEDYPLSRRLFLYTPSKVSNIVSSLIKFIESDDGQRIVEQVGFVSQEIKVEKPSLPRNATQKYKQITENGFRFSTNIRFKENGNMIDNKSKLDIKRISEFIKKEKLDTYKIFCIVHSFDGKTDEEIISNAEKKSLVVSSLLELSAGCEIKCYIIGNSMPIALGENSDEKNNRVELWFKM